MSATYINMRRHGTLDVKSTFYTSGFCANAHDTIFLGKPLIGQQALELNNVFSEADLNYFMTSSTSSTVKLFEGSRIMRVFAVHRSGNSTP